MRLILSMLLLFSLTGCQDTGKEEERKYRKIAGHQKSIIVLSDQQDGCVALARVREPNEVLGICMKEAAGGNRAAEAALGDLYAKSFQWKDAIEWYEIAAKHGDTHSQYQVAKLYLNTKEASLYFRDALNWLLISAKASYVPSQLLLAKIYHEGKWVERNDYLAFQWYVECAKDEPEAAFQVGVALLTGELGQKQNIEQGILYINYAALKHYPPAEIVLRNIETQSKKTEGSFQKSIENFKDEALKGSANAQLSLAKMLMQYSIPKYDKAALYWATESAKQGNQEAKFLLGQFYHEGIGTEVNYARALVLFSDLVRQQHSQAKFWLGKMYAEGHGVEKDEYLGKTWIMEAANEGVQEAKTIVEIWSNAQVDQAMLEQDYSNDMRNEPISADDLNRIDYENTVRIY